jgi:hypothetical protein
MHVDPAQYEQLARMMEQNGVSREALNGLDPAMLDQIMNGATNAATKTDFVAPKGKAAVTALLDESLNPDHMGPVLAEVRKLLPEPAQTPPAAVEMVNETRTLIDKELARLDGVNPDGEVQGYQNYAKVEDLGKIRGNIQFLEMMGTITPQ